MIHQNGRAKLTGLIPHIAELYLKGPYRWCSEIVKLTASRKAPLSIIILPECCLTPKERALRKLLLGEK